MPFLLILIGLLLVVTAFRNTIGQFATHLDEDLTSKNQGGASFIVWVAAIIGIGLLGYIPGLRGLSRGFLALIVIVVIIGTQGSIFQQAFDQLRQAPPQQPAQPAAPANLGPLPIQVQVSGGGGKSANSGASGVIGAIGGKVAESLIGGFFL